MMLRGELSLNHYAQNTRLRMLRQPAYACVQLPNERLKPP